MTYRIYTIPNCIYCDRAKSLLNRLGIQYEQIHCADASDLPTGLTTFPQIYYGTKHLGGCMELYDLHRKGFFSHLIY